MSRAYRKLNPERNGYAARQKVELPRRSLRSKRGARLVLSRDRANRLNQTLEAPGVECVDFPPPRASSGSSDQYVANASIT